LQGKLIVTDRIRAQLPTVTLEAARQLRSLATDVENKLWYHLRGGRLNGVKFRRQHPIPPYVVDFYCHANKLVIELDGMQHSEEADRQRTQFLERRGLTVLRFTNHEVLLQQEAVLEAIWKLLERPPLTPTPLPAGEGL
jgi:very-short-patch-repair endonuclease